LSLMHLRKPDEALVPFRKGVACQPIDLELQLGLGEALLEVGQHEELKRTLKTRASSPRTMPVRAGL
jgi:hypothetical protein